MRMMEFREDHCREDLFPLTLTRPVADIRVGILTIREKWQHAGVDPAMPIPANLVPSLRFMEYVRQKGWDAAREVKDSYRVFQYPWDLPTINHWAIQADLELMTRDRDSAPVSSTNRIIGSGALFLEDGVNMECAILNTSQGPIYIGAGAVVMEGVMLRGPLAVGAGAVIKMGATIYGATTIGPGSIVGGEVKNSIIMGNSNKAHEGFLGDAVIGEWCNLGAGTSCSNLRNNASDVNVWHMASGSWRTAGTKCGLIMGDHSRSCINASFNTGTVVGVSANIFQAGVLLPKFIPSFSWGASGEERYHLDKALEHIRHWMAFKHQVPTGSQINRLTEIYNQEV